MSPATEEFSLDRGGRKLAGERLATESDPGERGPEIVLAHGLTATRRYVVHGSKALPRDGHTLIAYDAASHGSSDPAPEGEMDYGLLRDDLLAVAELKAGEGGPILAGHSMGAHTIAAALLERVDAFAAAVIIGPVYTGTPADEETLAYWDRLADGMQSGGVEGFLEAYEKGDFDPDWRETILRITRDRLARHEHPEAVARALREIPRSEPFGSMSELESLDLPVLVVASHDEADASHPYAAAEAYAEAIPGAELISEEQGESPLAWQGGKLSRAIAEFAARDDVRERAGA